MALQEVVVSDSACLIGLERIGQLDLLPALFGTIYVPSKVVAEFGRSLPFFQIQTVRDRLSVTLLQSQIDAGEAEAIVLAGELNALLLLDDRRARQVAEQRSIPVLGTVGLLIKAKEANLILYIKPLLDDLLIQEFRISKALYTEALRRAGEL